jgi:hypothetical protein
MAQEAQFDVVWPLGLSRVDEVAVNERPHDLSGRTVAFIWDWLFKGPEIFEIVRERLSATYSDVRFIDHSVFGNIHGTDAEEKANLGAMADRLREHDVDVAVVAVGA